jgi:KipI family sensor histidine kinase inhibitor
MRFLTCGECGILVELTDLDETLRIFAALRAFQKTDMPPETSQDALHAVTQLIPAAHTILISFDPLIASRTAVIAAVRTLDASDDVCRRSRNVEIPVIYDGEDLTDIAQLLGISTSQVITRHCAGAWSVAFVGFAPGFAYLTGGDEIFNVPRRKVPRLSVPAGAVGLAGAFSGIYPRASSGGWQLLGHTETAMWNEFANPPALLQPGDMVRFVPAREHAVIGAVSDSSDGNELDEQGISNVTDASGATSGEAVTALEAVRPGLLTTFQDDGRRAANMGVTGSGAADPRSFHLANTLVGNSTDTPVLEITGGGACFTSHGDMVVAVCGAPVPIAISGKTGRTAVIQQEAMLLRDGETIEIGVPTSGLRDYLAVRGGFDVVRSLGSASTDTMSGIGPKPIVAGQLLPVLSYGAQTNGMYVNNTHAGGVGMPEPWPNHLPESGDITELHVHLGPRDDWFTAAGISDFLNRVWTVSAQSNRVGLRLQGECPLERRDAKELASEATLPGSIEVPTSGQPVVFLRDQPVTGGYPVIAVLTAQSLDIAGQLPPGAKIRFRMSEAFEPDEQRAQSQETKEVR